MSGSELAAELRGFGPLGIIAFLVILLAGNYPLVPLSAVLVLVWARWSRTPWRELGFVRPASWPWTVVGGIALGIALKFLLKAIVMPLLGAPPVNQAFHYLAGNTSALPFAAYRMIVVAGFGEETVFRGFLFERAGKLIGDGLWAKVFTVIATAAWFGVSHYSLQGLAGAEQGAIVGLIFGAIYARTGRLWMLIVAHAAFDLTALAMIYWDVEEVVARSVFG